jgi:hypothetical protein
MLTFYLILTNNVCIQLESLSTLESQESFKSQAMSISVTCMLDWILSTNKKQMVMIHIVQKCSDKDSSKSNKRLLKKILITTSKRVISWTWDQTVQSSMERTNLESWLRKKTKQWIPRSWQMETIAPFVFTFPTVSSVTFQVMKSIGLEMKHLWRLYKTDFSISWPRSME